MTLKVPGAITSYFEADARRETDAVVALFTDDAVVIDESKRWRDRENIRAWRHGPASAYQYTTEVFDTVRTDDGSYLVTGRLDGNFPGGTAEVEWRFTIVGDRISRLEIS